MKPCKHVILCALLCLACSVQAASYQARVSSVPDGDTVWVRPLDGSAPRKLRLLGIDAPEICQAGGPDARAALQALVAGQVLLVTENETDAYQRGLASLQRDNTDVAEALVRQGMAWAARWHGQITHYAAQESAARAQGLGVWAQAQPQSPRDFRQAHGSCYPQWTR
jgi:micrococcal nuclease